jgi:hypothetical protein
MLFAKLGVNKPKNELPKPSILYGFTKGSSELAVHVEIVPEGLHMRWKTQKIDDPLSRLPDNNNNNKDRTALIT